MAGAAILPPHLPKDKILNDIVNFRFTLVPMHKPEELHANMRSAVARGLPLVGLSHPHDGTLSIIGGGPSLEGTCRSITGYAAAINGSIQFLLDLGVVPQMAGICDPSPHMVDLIAADPRVTYFVASVVNPAVFDKLLAAGCRVYLWHMSSVPGGEELLAEIMPDNIIVGGASTMGLRWLSLGYQMGFRKFVLHGMDSSFRVDEVNGRRSHAYPDHQDDKEWMNFDGYQTRVNFVGQVMDFIGCLDRAQEEDVDPIEIEVMGEGLLQSKFRQWKERNPGWHEGVPKPKLHRITDGFEWPKSDRVARPSALGDVAFMGKFLALVPGRQTVVQAGANVGVYPAHLAQHFHEVFAFEPEPENYRCLLTNLELMKGNIRVFNAALGDGDTTCGLRLCEANNSGSWAVSGGGDIPMRTIDSLKLSSCDLIWLDIEGFEPLALQGASETIDRLRPAVIIEEKFGNDAASDWLKARGYYFALQHARDKLFLC